jgi:hypothetical protein
VEEVTVSDEHNDQWRADAMRRLDEIAGEIRELRAEVKTMATLDKRLALLEQKAEVAERDRAAAVERAERAAAVASANHALMWSALLGAAASAVLAVVFPLVLIHH